ncbi:MAG: hypothetical protein AB8G16_17935 [Gammaproteobacteria bacterium]
MNDKADSAAPAVQMTAQLTATYFDTGEPRELDISYRVDNRSAASIGVLNTAATVAGDPPGPDVTINAAGDLTVAYQLHAPRAAQMAVPQNIYAVRVAPGEHYTQQVAVKLLSAYPARDVASGLVRPGRVRFCQAYAVHANDGFTRLEIDQRIWLTQPGLFEAQEMLCSEWVELRQK